MVWRLDDPQGNEADKIKYLIVPYTRGQGLDLGCGPWKAFPHFTGVDDKDEWTNLDWEPDIRADCTDLSMFADNGLDFVFSSHLLEHIEDTAGALSEWWRVIKPGGHLVLYLPHKNLYPNIGEPGANPDHKHDFLPDDIIEAMRAVEGWDLVRNQTRSGGTEYSFLQVYRKRADKRRKLSYKKNEPTADSKPRCLVIRYGGIGDMILASGILPGLKDQGYHVTLQTTPRGHEIVRHDPHIDDFWLQDHNQVPNQDLQHYWMALGEEFDHVVNLSESIEGALLALPDRRNHALPKLARHLVTNVNYMEMTHAIAEVPLPSKQHFYATAAERTAAREFRHKLGAGPVVLWALSGSSVHKVWPWVDMVIAWLIENTAARIVLTGDPTSQLLEAVIAQGLAKHALGLSYEDSNEMKLSELLLRLKEHWGGVNRIVCRSGDWGVRETLAFLPECDLVVGPETGVLNAAALLPVAKVAMLSHSTEENLTKHWVNTTAIVPPEIHVPCYPCHRLHYGREFCPQDPDTGAAVCAAAIRPQQVFEACMIHLMNRKAA